MHQLTVTFPASSPGLLAEVCRALADAGVNIPDTAVVEDRRKAGIVMQAEPLDDAERVLLDEGFTVERQHTLVIRVDDKPGSIAPVAEKLKNERINVRSMHVLQRKDGDKAMITVHTDANDAARRVLGEMVVA